MIVDIIIMLSFNLNLLKERRYVDQELDCDCETERERSSAHLMLEPESELLSGQLLLE